MDRLDGVDVGISKLLGYVATYTGATRSQPTDSYIDRARILAGIVVN